jgi:fatty acid desaturase
MNCYPIWPVEIAGVIVIAFSIQAMAILMHEALHRNLFRRSGPDRWAAFLLAIPALFSAPHTRLLI